MKFELEFNGINFLIELKQDPDYIPDDRFEKLANQTLIEIKKNYLSIYSVTITSSKLVENENHQMTFFLSGVILSSVQDEIIEDLQEYLDQENIIEDICEAWKNYALKDGPTWKI